MLLPAALPGLELVYPDATWTTATPEAMGMSSARLATAYANLGDYRGNIAVVRYGRLVSTSNDVTRPRALYSANKSITAMIAARLMQQGRITLDTGVSWSNDAPEAGRQWSISAFSDGTPHPDRPLAHVRHFMSMTSDFGLAGYEPGAHYAYNNNAVHAYGTWMNRTCFGNTTAVAMLEQALFDHVGGHQDTISYNGQYGGWDGGWKASARDCARLGLLMLARGSWNGSRLLPASWVDACFVHQIASDATANYDKGTNTRWNQHGSTDHLDGGYSYGWWLHGANRMAAHGRGGNFIIVLRDLDLVIAVVNDEPDRRPSASTYIREITAAVTGDSTDEPPTVAQAASVSPSPVTGTTATLSVLGADDGGEAALTYTWSTTGTPPATVAWSANGNNAAKTVTVTFAKAGTYQFRATITDADGLSTTSSVTVDVLQDPSAISIGSP